MKAIISSTYDDLYLFFLPICVWTWNRLGVDVICFMPYLDGESDNKKIDCVNNVLSKVGLHVKYIGFDAPENKKATYAQCSRLYGAALFLDKDEILVIGDIDMAMFKLPPTLDGFTVFGSDLVPDNQYPMCYISAKVKHWRKAFKMWVSDGVNEYGQGIGHLKKAQECLDELLGDIECENMRGNYWSKDQHEAYLRISKFSDTNLVTRAREGTQFASNRIDRDDAYFMDRLSPDIVDYHMHRPGYTPENVEKIIAVIQYFYPNEDLNWIREYAETYRKIIGE